MSGDSPVAVALDRARALIDAGDQGDADTVLSRALDAAGPAVDAADATAIAEATGLLVSLTALVVPEQQTAALLDRMRVLTAAFHDEETVVARAEAELQGIEWVHELADDNDPVVLVDALRQAEGFATHHIRSEVVGVRRAAAEAGLTACLIRAWLGQGAAGLALAHETLALSLAGEDDERLRVIRVQALQAAAGLRVDTGESEHARMLLRQAAVESASLPQIIGMRLATLLRLVDLAQDAGEDGAAELEELRVELIGDPADESDAVRRCRFLDLRLARIPAEDRAAAEHADWTDAIVRYRRAADPGVRRALLGHLRFRGGAPSTLTAQELQLLRYADAVFRDDLDPETELARLDLAVRIVQEIGHPDGTGSASASQAEGRIPGDAAAAIALAEDIERRFPLGAARAESAPLLLRTLLERSLRLSEIGRSDEAISLLRTARSRFAGVDDQAPLQHLFAQAGYWVARLERERGEPDAALRLVDALVREFGSSGDVDVRIWAANALFSTWRAESASDEQREWASAAFVTMFAAEDDIRFLRLDASRLNTLAHRAHSRGDAEAAIAQFEAVVARYRDAEDAEIAEAVALASENLRILAATSGPGRAKDDRYRELRDRLYATDDLAAQGRVAEAAAVWSAIADETAGSPDPDTALLGLAALDAWSGHLEERGEWGLLHDVARRASVIGGGGDGRARTVQARAHLRLASALTKLGEPRRAVEVYDALERLVDGAGDDELVLARQQGAYNRAVVLDDLGDVDSALRAYDQVLAAHAGRVESPQSRLRQVKALRNKALLLDGLGRVADAAGAHRHVLDIAGVAPDQALAERARASAFELAACFARLGDPASAAATYAWIRTATGLGFDAADLRAARQAEKAAAKDARRHGR